MKSLVAKLKEISIINNRKRILKNYYSKELRKGKTYRASLLDKVLFYTIIFIGLTGYLFAKSKELLPSIFLSALLLYFIRISTSQLFKKSKEKKISAINEGLKKKKLIREFSNLNKEGFINYIKILFKDYYDTEVEDADLPLDLQLTKEGDVFGIKCIKASMEDRIGTRELEVFHRELKSLGLEDGILVTNTHFTEGLKNNTRLILLGFDDIVEILKEIDRYPSDQDMEDYIVDRFIDRRNSIKSQVKSFNKRKIIQLYGLCAIFYILSFFIPFARYYKLMAVLSFLIASLVSGYKISEYIRMRDRVKTD
ncbi:MAG: hypothetical protein ACOXZT_03690 [Tissierellaceae bacterium]|jgi:VIT1/CCC1 family predicted Fe2+/Mn2+ transporter|nr:hypothetical protein [Tissierellia bacterium]